MNFFFDRCIGVRLAHMLDAYDSVYTAVHHDDDRRFTPSTTDIEIIDTLACDTPRPVFITADRAMRRNSDEREALRWSGLTIVFFRAGFHNLDFHTQAVKLLSIWPKIVEAAENAVHPTAFEITPSARKVDRLCLTRDL